jgi:hypothetical protein
MQTERDRQTDRLTERDKDSQIKRKRERKLDMQTERDRQTEREKNTVRDNIKGLAYSELTDVHHIVNLFNFCTVKPLYNGHPWDLKKVAV